MNTAIAKLVMLVVGVAMLAFPILTEETLSAGAVRVTPEEVWNATIADIAARDGITLEQASWNLSAFLDGLHGVTVSAEAVQTGLPPVIGSYAHPVERVERWHGLALSVGWPDSDWRKLSCIIYRESNGQDNVHNSRDPGKGSFGLLQINSVNTKFLRQQGVLWNIGEALNPEINLRAGLALKQASGWSPWKSKYKPC